LADKEKKKAKIMMIRMR